METKRCVEQVRERGFRFPRYSQCQRRATMEHDGKPYCKQHHPDTVKARQDAADAKYHEKHIAPIRREARLRQEHAKMRALLEDVVADGRLQSYEDRERFRAKARALLAKVRS